jgi:hypothetical protein
MEIYGIESHLSQSEAGQRDVNKTLKHPKGKLPASRRQPVLGGK